MSTVRTLKQSYEVEAIEGKKTIKGQTLYNVKWKHFSQKDNTWEPKQNLSNVINLVNSFDSMKITRSHRKEQMIDENDFIKSDENIIEDQEQEKEKEKEKVEVRLWKEETVQDYGSFEKEDRVKKILSAKIISKKKRKIHFQVEWKKRKTNVQPLDSLVKNEQMLCFEKDKLIDYYEQHLQFNKS